MAEDPHDTFARSLSEEDELLLILRDELYGGSWDRFLRDLDDRLRGRPYIFKLVHRIEEDIDRIQRIRAYEEEHGVDLARYLPQE